MVAQKSPQFEVPSPEADSPPWGKVGVIAILGFVIGVAWPRLAGISLGPNPPADAPRAAAAAPSASAAKVTLSAVAAVNAPAPGASAAGATGDAAPGNGNEQGIAISPLEITRCRDAKGKNPDACDKIQVDSLFTPRLKELSRCPSALGLSGKVSTSFDLDFKAKTLKVQRAKAKLPRTTLDGLTRCIEKSFNGVSLDEIAHENNRYSLGYEVTFLAPGQQAEAEAVAEKSTPLDGKTAKVAWRSCQVRETPKSGNVVGKLNRGAEVKLLEKKEDWYRIESGDKKGWISGAALDSQP